MPLFLGSDHAGYRLKEELREFLAIEFPNEEVFCFGAENESSIDYPLFVQKLAHQVVSTPSSLGIALCGTGIGVSIVSNKIPGIRAALCTNPTMARLARKHNNANILTMGGRIIGPELAKDIVRSFLETSFEGGRHQQRLNMISDVEKKYYSCGS